MSTTERARAIAELIVDRLFVNVQADRLVLTARDGRDLGGWGRGPACDRIEQALVVALAAPVVPEPPTWSHRVDSDCEDEFLIGVGCIVCEVKQLRAALAFTRQVAELKRCEDEPKACYSDSGPYCGTHDYYVDSLIEEARAVLQRVKQL